MAFLRAARERFPRTRRSVPMRCRHRCRAGSHSVVRLLTFAMDSRSQPWYTLMACLGEPLEMLDVAHGGIQPARRMRSGLIFPGETTVEGVSDPRCVGPLPRADTVKSRGEKPPEPFL